jgi:hypothetical protein
VIVAVIGAVPLLIAANDTMFPEPIAASPMLVVLFTQVYVVVPTLLLVVNGTASVFELLHNNWSAGSFTCPVGFTVMVNVLVGPMHDVPPYEKVGVTIIIAVIGAVVILIAVKDILPVPLAAIPIEVLSFVQA